MKTFPKGCWDFHCLNFCHAWDEHFSSSSLLLLLLLFPLFLWTSFSPSFLVIRSTSNFWKDLTLFFFLKFFYGCVLNIATPGGICLCYGELFLATGFYCMLCSGLVLCRALILLRLDICPLNLSKLMEWIRCFSLCQCLLWFVVID